MNDALELTNEFDLGDRAYLEGANHGPMPRRSLEAARQALDRKRDPTLIDDGDYFALPDRIRQGAAPLFGCDARDVAIATGASHGINLVACGLDWKPGDRVVIGAGEFPANALPWRYLRGRGVQVEEVRPDRLVDAIEGARVVSVGHVNYATGLRLDLDEIGAACTATGALFVVDVSQSLGAVPVNVRSCGATVVAAAGYKWLLSPYGTGLTYVHPQWVDRLPVPGVNWSTIQGAEDFNRLADLDPVFRPGACRFDVPETAAFVHGAAMAESLELIGRVGAERAQAHSWQLIDRLASGLPPGFEVESDLDTGRRSTIVRIVAGDAERTRRVHRSLRESGVAVSLREGGLRVAPGIWNTADDIDRLLAGLRAVD